MVFLFIFQLINAINVDSITLKVSKQLLFSVFDGFYQVLAYAAKTPALQDV